MELSDLAWRTSHDEDWCKVGSRTNLCLQRHRYIHFVCRQVQRTGYDLNQYTEDPLLGRYRQRPPRFGRKVNLRDRLLGATVIVALIVGLWWLVFYDSTSYVFTAEQVETVFKPDTVEEGSGYSIYLNGGSEPSSAVILLSGARDEELDEAISRVEGLMSTETDRIAKEFPRELIYGADFKFHNLIIYCAFWRNCGAYEREFLAEVQSLGIRDELYRQDQFVPSTQ